MKKLLSVLLAIMMLVSVFTVSAITASADEEKQYTMSAIVMLCPYSADDDFCNTRFIFNWTEADNPEIPEGFEAWWGIGAGDDYTGYIAEWNIPGEWHWDENGNMCIDVYFNLPYLTAGEEYAAAKNGELKGYICDLGNGGEFIHDDINRTSVFDLVPNCVMTENQYGSGLNNNAIVLPIQDAESYYGDKYVPETEEVKVTKAPEPKETEAPEPKETKAPETKASETKANETKAPESANDTKDAGKTEEKSDTTLIILLSVAAAVIVIAVLAIIFGKKKK